MDITNFLDNGEDIVATITPNKYRYVLSILLRVFLWTLWIFVLTELVLVCINVPAIYWTIPLCEFGISIPTAIVVSILKIRRTRYIITTRRVITSTGVISTTYKYLDIENIGNVACKIYHSMGNIWDIGSVYIYQKKDIHQTTATLQLDFLDNPTQICKLLRK